MAYQTLYLRWRPSGFDTLVGQVPVKQALMNALSSGRIAHAYLFTGPRGTGKTTTARIFAKALNCLNGPTDHPCGECLNCRQITDGSAMDVQELDAASNRGVDDIKNLNKNADFAPVNCRYKVYIIDEAHMLTTEACMWCSSWLPRNRKRFCRQSIPAASVLISIPLPRRKLWRICKR